jgi:hypothetical protein
MTFKEWYESKELDRRVDNDYTEQDIEAAWNAGITEALRRLEAKL